MICNGLILLQQYYFYRKIDKIDRGLDKGSEGLDNLDKTLNKLDGPFNEFDKELDKCDKNLDGLLEPQAEHSVKLDKSTDHGDELTLRLPDECS